MASLAVRALVAGRRRRFGVLGASTHAVWLDGGHDVLVLSTRDATRLPNSVELPFDADRALMASIPPGDTMQVGGGFVTGGPLTVRVVRWWDPRLVLAPVAPGVLERRLNGLPGEVPGIDSEPLACAIRARCPTGVLDAATELLGLGDGLTPEADDMVAGTLAGTRCLGHALGMRRSVAALDAVAPVLMATAMARTTTFSAALLRHALRGEVAAPAAAFLRALAGRGDVVAAHTQLRKVGHSSGRALAAGIVLAGRTLIATA